MTRIAFHLATVTFLFSTLVGCATQTGVYAQPSAQQSQATLIHDAPVYGSAVPAVQVIEINGKAVAAQPGSMMKKSATYRLHPGPVHLFLTANTGRGVGASSHLDFVARSGASYRIDLAVGMRDIAFLVTENGKTIATGKAAKEVSNDPLPASTPMFIPIIVN